VFELFGLEHQRGAGLHLRELPFAPIPQRPGQAERQGPEPGHQGILPLVHGRGESRNQKMRFGALCSFCLPWSEWGDLSEMPCIVKKSAYRRLSRREKRKRIPKYALVLEKGKNERRKIMWTVSGTEQFIEDLRGAKAARVGDHASEDDRLVSSLFNLAQRKGLNQEPQREALETGDLGAEDQFIINRLHSLAKEGPTEKEEEPAREELSGTIEQEGDLVETLFDLAGGKEQT
jgi:hypothetical protein